MDIKMNEVSSSVSRDSPSQSIRDIELNTMDGQLIAKFHREVDDLTQRSVSEHLLPLYLKGVTITPTLYKHTRG